jgi:hypothetical protein
MLVGCDDRIPEIESREWPKKSVLLTIGKVTLGYKRLCLTALSELLLALIDPI